MVAILLQCITIVLLAAAAAYLRIAHFRERSVDWEDLFHKLSVLNSKFADISHHQVLSRGLAIDSRDIWTHIEGWRGLRRMYRGAGLFVSALDHIEQAENSSERSAKCAKDLRSAACCLRFVILGSLGGSLARGLLQGGFFDGTVAVLGYLSLRAEFAYFLNDYRPDLLALMRESQPRISRRSYNEGSSGRRKESGNGGRFT